MLSAPDGLVSIARVVRYTLLVSEFVTVEDIEAVLVPAVGEQLREVIMTEGQRLIEKGRREGLAQGEARGEARGRAHAVLAVLGARGIAVPDDIRDRVLSCTDVATLDGWIERAARAASAVDVVSEG